MAESAPARVMKTPRLIGDGIKHFELRANLRLGGDVTGGEVKGGNGGFNGGGFGGFGHDSILIEW